MPRGRQYYDPIVQVPGMVEGDRDLSRVEVFQDESLQWTARQVAADGSLTGATLKDFNHDGLLKLVGEWWPTLAIYELRSEGEDSTWEGHGPSPRIFQNSSPETGASGAPLPEPPSGPSPDKGAGDEQHPEEYKLPNGELVQVFGQSGTAPQPTAEIEVSGNIHGWEGSDADYMAEQVPLRLIPVVELGSYVLLSDICDLLEMWAVSYEVDKNPSGALALREAVDVLRDVG